jgi:predicted flap endonuclease-1-like 5' DNA nuclease
MIQNNKTVITLLSKMSPLSGEEGQEAPPARKWLWALLPNVIVLAGVVAWLWLRRQSMRYEQPTYIPLAPKPQRTTESKRNTASAPAATLGQAHPDEAAADDLTRVEGIGPKISHVLREAGILTYAQLAGTGLNELELMLHKAGIRLADPGTWPEQASLASAREWEALKELQSHLKGGRRIA